MQLASNNYANWKAIVDQLVADSAVASIFYFVDTSIAEVSLAWAVINAAPLVVVGEFGNNGPSAVTFIADFAAAVQITTPLAVEG